eukprot:gene15579-21040_t
MLENRLLNLFQIRSGMKYDTQKGFGKDWKQFQKFSIEEIKDYMRIYNQATKHPQVKILVQRGMPYNHFLKHVKIEMENHIIDPDKMRLYHLPNGKHLEPDRVQIKTNEYFQSLLDELFDSNYVPTVYLFNYENDSPKITPVKSKISVWEKSSNKDSSVRSGQLEFSRMASHVVAYKEKNNLPKDELLEMLERCHISDVQDPANAITLLCYDCDQNFDNHFVAINPDTNLLEVTNALLYSETLLKRQKWTSLNGKGIKPRTNRGHWPTKEALEVKYKVFLLGHAKRKEKQAKEMYPCPDCGKFCKSETGVKQHQRMQGCEKFKNVKNNVQHQKTPEKALTKYNC